MVREHAATSGEINLTRTDSLQCHCLGPAKVFNMRGSYRQTFQRVSADGEETTQSANLKVETNKIFFLPVVMKGVRVS